MKIIIFIIVLFFNTLISLGILLIPGIALKRKWCLSVSCIMLPVFGLVGIGLVYLLRLLGGQQDIDENDLSVKLPGLEYVSAVDFEKEVNVVPVEEALLINPDRTKRQMVMEAIKHNPANYLISLKKALHADDSETAHYAASGITDVKRILEREVIETGENYKKQPTNRVIINQYIDALNHIVESNLSVDIMQRKYQFNLASAIKALIGTGAIVKEDRYELLIDTLMKIDCYEEAIDWAQRFVKAYPENEKPLIYVLDIAYALKNNQAFHHALDALKHANFATSTHTREIIAYWDEANEK